jgi:endonuclease/exonuclease/phosphatase family metal-dependent hydrolase
MIVCKAPRAPFRRPEQTVRRQRRPLLLASSGAYLLATIALWVVLRETGDRWWPGTFLLLAPRWPFAFPLILLGPWALVTRHWKSIVATGAATMVMLFMVMGFNIATPRLGKERSQLRLLSCNIHRQHLDTALMAEYIADVKPDVVALQGWSDLQLSLFEGTTWNVQRVGEILVASRFPIGEVRPLAISEDDGDHTEDVRGNAVAFEIKLPQGVIHLISLHLASPHAGLASMWSDRGDRLANNIERRWRESERLREAVDHIQGTLLLAGDFNTVSESPLLREHWADFSDAFLERGTGLGFTYLVNHTQIRIDHILADSSCEVARCWVGPDVRAAHRPLVADIDFR